MSDNEFLDVLIPEQVVTPRGNYINFTGQESKIPSLKTFKEEEARKARVNAAFNILNQQGPLIPKIPSRNLFSIAAGKLGMSDKDRISLFGYEDNPFTCIYTATGQYGDKGAHVSGNRTLWDNPNLYGFMQVPNEQYDVGDLIQFYSDTGPHHSVLVTGADYEGQPVVSYSNGEATDYTVDEDTLERTWTMKKDVDHFDDLKEDLGDIRTYRYVGSPSKQQEWEEKWRSMYGNRHADGGKLPTPLDWNELTMKEKAAYIRMGVANGYKDIDSIRQVYNEFQKGGYLYGGGGTKKSNTPPQEYIYDVLPRMLREAGLNIRVTSGYRKPGEVGTAGSRSWHPRHGAVDIVPQGRTTFEDIEEVLHTNPTIVKYMLDNGFGLLDESGRSQASRDTMKRTGATGAHFHIGRDSKPAAAYRQRVASIPQTATTDNRKVYFSNPFLPIPEDTPKQAVSIQTPAKPLLNTTLDSNISADQIVMQQEEPIIDKQIPEVVVTAEAPRQYAMPNPQELLDQMNSMMVPYELPEIPKPVTATERLVQLNQDKNSLLQQDLENSILRASRFGTPLDEIKLARDVKDLQFYRNMAADGGNIFQIGGPKGRQTITNLSPWDEMAAQQPIAYTLGKLLDPTGITGYSDTKEAWKEFKNEPALNTGYNAVMETLGSLPVIGGKGKILKTIQGLVTGQGVLNDWNHAKEMQNAYNKELVVDYWDNTVKPREEAYKHNEQIKKKMSYTEVNHLPAFSLAPKGTKVGDILPNYNINNALIEKYKNKHAFGGPLVDTTNAHIYDGTTEGSQQMNTGNWEDWTYIATPLKEEPVVTAPRKYFVRYDEDGNPIYTEDYALSQEAITNSLPEDPEVTKRKQAVIDIKNRPAGQMSEWMKPIETAVVGGVGGAMLTPFIIAPAIASGVEGLLTAPVSTAVGFGAGELGAQADEKLGLTKKFNDQHWLNFNLPEGTVGGLIGGLAGGIGTAMTGADKAAINNYRAWKISRAMNKSPLKISDESLFPGLIGWEPKQVFKGYHASNEKIFNPDFFYKGWAQKTRNAPFGIYAAEGKFPIKGFLSKRPYMHQVEASLDKPMVQIGEVMGNSKNEIRNQIEKEAQSLGADGIIFRDIADNQMQHQTILKTLNPDTKLVPTVGFEKGNKATDYINLFSSPEHTGVTSKVITDPNDANFVLKVPKEGLTQEQVQQAITQNQTLGKYPFMLPQEHVETITGDDGLFYPIWKQQKITPYGREAIFGPDGKLLQGEALEAQRAKSNELVEAIRQQAQQQGLQLQDGRILTPDGLIQDFGEFHNVGITPDGKPIIFDAQLNTATKMQATPTITAENAASITPEQWTAAQDAAIAKGDIAEAQRLRDLHTLVDIQNPVVQLDGYPLQLFRGERYKRVDPTLGRGQFQEGVYLSTDKDYARQFTGLSKYNQPKESYLENANNDKLSSYYIFGDKITDIDFPINAHNILRYKYGDTFNTLDEHVVNKYNILRGHDAIVDNSKWYNSQGTEYVVQDPRHVKLSDAVTYDNNGVRIPLGKRDNFNINDRRYSWLPWLLGGASIGTINTTNR